MCHHHRTLLQRGVTPRRAPPSYRRQWGAGVQEWPCDVLLGRKAGQSCQAYCGDSAANPCRKRPVAEGRKYQPVCKWKQGPLQSVFQAGKEGQSCRLFALPCLACRWIPETLTAESLHEALGHSRKLCPACVEFLPANAQVGVPPPAVLIGAHECQPNGVVIPVPPVLRRPSLRLGGEDPSHMASLIGVGLSRGAWLPAWQWSILWLWSLRRSVSPRCPSFLMRNPNRCQRQQAVMIKTLPDEWWRARLSGSLPSCHLMQFTLDKGTSVIVPATPWAM